MMSSNESTIKETYVDEAKRRIAHLSYKLEQATKRIRTLEHELAEAERWQKDVAIPRFDELTQQIIHANQRKFNKRRYENL